MDAKELLIKILDELFDTAVRKAVSKRTNTEFYFYNAFVTVYMKYNYFNVLSNDDKLDILHLMYDKQKSLRNICEIYAD